MPFSVSLGLHPCKSSLRTSPLFSLASYIEIPFMILPIFNALDDLDENIVNASKDLGANDWQTFTKVIFPLSLNGVRSGVQSVFIPSLMPLYADTFDWW